MKCAIVSDLHLGAGSDADLLRRDEAIEPLLEVIADADQLILLGDIVELRDRPLSEAIELAAPILSRLIEAAGGAATLVPGNHDHRLVSGWLELRTAIEAPTLGLSDSAALDDWPVSELAKAVPDADIAISYPGVWVRDDVFATHGHYLDRHLTIPTFERLGLSLVERTLGLTPEGPDPLDPPELKSEPDSPDDYERVAAPVYAFLYALAQAGAASGHPGGSPTKRIWDALSGGEGPTARLRGWLLGSVALPGAVGVANRLGIGPVKADLSPNAITRAGVDAMAEVVERLGIAADHVIFGHTHRRGPLPAEARWSARGGQTTLWNTGSWVHSPGLLRETSKGSAYWPGTVAVVGAEGPPELLHLLDDWTREDLAG